MKPKKVTKAWAILNQGEVLTLCATRDQARKEAADLRGMNRTEQFPIHPASISILPNRKAR